MRKTENSNLNLPEYTDVVDIEDINKNFETIDEHLGMIITADGGVHGWRYNPSSKKIEFFDSEKNEWVTITEKDYVDSAVSNHDTDIKKYIAELIGGVEEALEEADALLGGD